MNSWNSVLKHCRYTSFSGLFPLLSKGNLPLVRVEEISQTIDSESFTVQNSVVFAGPLATTSISTNAKFEVRSPKRVQVVIFFNIFLVLSSFLVLDHHFSLMLYSVCGSD